MILLKKFLIIGRADVFSSLGLCELCVLCG